MRAMRSRICRYVWRALMRKKLIAIAIGGIKASETSGEPDVQVKHDADDPADHDEIVHQSHHAGGKHFLQHIDVAGHARHQTSDRIAIEVAHRQSLHVRENRHAQVGQAALRHQHGHIVLDVNRDGFADQGDEEQQHHILQAP